MSTVLDKTIVSVALDKIKRDPRAQPRDHISMDVAAKYTEDMASGAEFPPLVVFFDGTDYWLADVWHRHYAAKGMELQEFPCDVRAGSIRDAILYSVGANATHGYPRSNADKRRAVAQLLNDDEWRGWSDREIAKRCLVGNKMVSDLRGELFPPTSLCSEHSEPRTYVTKHGTQAKMNTGRINEGREKPASDLWAPKDIAPDGTRAFFVPH